MTNIQQNDFNSVARVLGRTLTINAVDVDLDLLKSGLLDSLSLMQLIVNLEEHFAIVIEPEEMNINDYRTIRAIGLMVGRLRVQSEITAL